MRPVFLLDNKVLCIRKLKQSDLQYAYYNVMSLFSEVDRTILRTQEILDNLTNEYIFFVVKDLATSMIIATGTLIIPNTSTQSCQVGYIENIIIRHEYQYMGLGNIIFQYLKYYCLNTKQCIRVITNCNHNM